MKMTLEKYEVFCRRNGMVPVDKIQTKLGQLYIAEGYRRPEMHPDCQEESAPHYMMFWLFEVKKTRDSEATLDVGRQWPLSAIEYPIQKDRVEFVRRMVDDWIGTNVKHGRYTH